MTVGATGRRIDISLPVENPGATEQAERTVEATKRRDRPAPAVLATYVATTGARSRVRPPNASLPAAHRTKYAMCSASTAFMYSTSTTWQRARPRQATVGVVVAKQTAVCIPRRAQRYCSAGSLVEWKDSLGRGRWSSVPPWLQWRREATLATCCTWTHGHWLIALV